MKGYDIKFQIYAESDAEAEEARNAIVSFISELASKGRAVTGRKIADALPHWKDNVIVRNKIMDFFKITKQ